MLSASGQQRRFWLVASEAYLNHLHALIGQGLPDDSVGRELFVADHHLIAHLPVEAECHQRERLGSILHQRDIA
ncbi:hypothetical protein D3C80_1777700 [compost metagenome]